MISSVSDTHCTEWCCSSGDSCLEGTHSDSSETVGGKSQSQLPRHQGDYYCCYIHSAWKQSECVNDTLHHLLEWNTCTYMYVQSPTTWLHVIMVCNCITIVNIQVRKSFTRMGDVGMHHAINCGNKKSPYTINYTNTIVHSPLPEYNMYVYVEGKFTHDYARILDSIAKGTYLIP